MKRYSYKTFSLAADDADARMSKAGSEGYRVVFVTPPATATAPTKHFHPLAVMEREEPAAEVPHAG